MAASHSPRKVSKRRKVVRTDFDKGLKGHWQRYLTSFTPRGFKAYWLSRAGVIRIAKLAAVGFVFLILVLIWFAKDLPSPSKINARIGAANSTFWDRTHTVKLLEVHGDKNRAIIEFDQMPISIKQATIAIEDKDFYKHGAFSPQGLGRAFVGVLTRDRSKGGGSTITQQYVKNTLLSSEYSYTRKIKELILSFEIEQLYKKDDILKLYLNEIPYGSQAYGIEAASKTYFNKPAKELTLPESALLAAIPNLPTYYSPYGQHTDALIERQQIILDKMVEQGYISKQQADEAKKVDVLASIPKEPPSAYAGVYPHFTRYAQDYLTAKYGERTVTDGGLDITTTLDVKKQDEAQKAIDNNMSGVRKAGGSNAALVSSDPKTGQVLAMIGSYNYNDASYGQYNVALSERQPGSSFKPLVYATAFKGNWGPGSTLYDVPTDFGGGYQPKNYDLRNYGVQSVRTALDGSLNIPAVKMLHIVGVNSALKTARDLGITTLNRNASEYGLSLVLGSGEVQLNQLVNAYESFANGGQHYDPTPVLKVVDSKKKVVLDNTKKPTGKRVLDAQVAWLMADTLSDNKSRAYIFGQNNLLTIPGRKVAAKTGTTNDYKDAWTMGFSPDLVTGVWVGNNDNKSMQNSAVSIAAPIWNAYMKEALKSYPATSDFTKPAGLQQITLDANTGRLPTNATKARRTDWFPSWYKAQNVTGTQTAKIDKVSGKLATACTPDAAIETVTGGGISAEIPPSDPAYMRWQAPVAALARTLGYSAGGGAIPTTNDDLHNCSDTKPTVSVSATNSGGGLSITATVTSGTHTANKLVIKFDDQVISTQAISGSTTYTMNYNPTSGGSHTVSATVTDEALYSGTDSTTVTTSGGGSGFNGSSNRIGGSAVQFTWDAAGGPYQLVVNGNATTVNGTTAVRSAATGSSWYVVAANGQQTPFYTVN